MDDDRKKFGRGGKPAGSRSGERRGGPAKPGFGKAPAKAGFAKGPRKDGVKPFAKSGPKRDGERKFAGAEGPKRSDAPMGDRGDRKPFVKREFGDRPPRREGGERKFATAERPQRSDAPTREGGERKPFVKREGERKPFVKREFADKRSSDGAAPGRPQYWGKRPGKAERAEQAGTGDSSVRESSERKPFVKRDSGDRPQRRGFGQQDKPQGFGEGEKPRRFEPRGDRPKPFGGRSDGPQRDFKPKRADGPSVERKPFVRRGDAPVEDGERIAKRLARAGISSRRDAEELIAAGRVKVNGKVLASPAFNVTASDRIELDDTEIPAIERTRLFLFHKPAGVVTTNRDPEGRRTVFDVLPDGLPRLMTIGRLDINTEGLLLLTNDGGLSRVLELPATGWLRRYRVRVHGKVDEPALAGLKDGIVVDGVFYGSIEATLEREQGSNAWLTIGLREGKNREVKNVLGALGLDVTRLIRVSYGPFQLNELPEGHVLEIKGRMLRDQLGERLVEESGANFDADVAKPFSNKPVRRGEKVVEVHDERPGRTPRQIGVEKAGGLIKNFRRDREDKRDGKREDVLGRLSTTRPERPQFGGPDGFKRGDGDGRGGRFAAKSGKPDAGGKTGFVKKAGPGKREREERPIVEPGVRKANVWMALGARPIGTGRAATEKAGHAARKADKTGHGKPRFNKDAGKPRDHGAGNNGRPSNDAPRGPRKGGPKGGSGADRRR